MIMMMLAMMTTESFDIDYIIMYLVYFVSQLCLVICFTVASYEPSIKVSRLFNISDLTKRKLAVVSWLCF